MRLRLPVILAFLAVAGIISLASAAGPCVGAKRVICFGGKGGGGGPSPPGTCNGTIDLSAGCALPMLGGF